MTWLAAFKASLVTPTLPAGSALPVDAIVIDDDLHVSLVLSQPDGPAEDGLVNERVLRGARGDPYATHTPPLRRQSCKHKALASAATGTLRLNLCSCQRIRVAQLIRFI